MARFILALHEQPTTFADATPEQIQAVIAEYMSWRQGLTEQGLMEGGEKLCDEGGRHISKADDAILVSDGPFSEAKEVFAGFFLIKADDYDHAVRIAKTCPHVHNGRIEVRRIEEVDG